MRPTGRPGRRRPAQSAGSASSKLGSRPRAQFVRWQADGAATDLDEHAAETRHLGKAGQQPDDVLIPSSEVVSRGVGRLEAMGLIHRLSPRTLELKTEELRRSSTLPTIEGGWTPPGRTGHCIYPLWQQPTSSLAGSTRR